MHWPSAGRHRYRLPYAFRKTWTSVKERIAAAKTKLPPLFFLMKGYYMKFREWLIWLWQILKLTLKSFVSIGYQFNVYFGVPGSGKTTFAAWIARRATKKGIPVYSNVPVIGTYQLDPKEDLGKYMLEKCVLIIDEAGIEFDNRKFKEFPDRATRFFKLHRHYKVNVHVFSQKHNDFDKKMRDLATQYFILNKSLLPFLIHRVTYAVHIGVNEMTEEWTDKYKKVPFSHKWVFAPVLWLMFNSWDAPELPQKEWSQW